jgi:hypothetical protein
VISIGRVKSFGPKPLKYFCFGFDHENFLIWVDEGWQTCVEGSLVFFLYAKLMSLSISFKSRMLRF